jgi:phosphoribosylanthranilate isomerase
MGRARSSGAACGAATFVVHARVHEVTRIKICGITSIGDALAAVELGAHALGFVFAPSPRHIEPTAAREIVRALPPFVTAVAVVMDEAVEELRKKLRTSDCHYVQLHGSESPGYLDALRGWGIIKAFRIGRQIDLEQLADYDRADAFLLDSRVRGKGGGTGASFDWRLARTATDQESPKAGGKPIILAGGLHPGNVRAALEMARPYAVDVSSGVEAAPGKKDHDLMRDFIRAVRDHDASQA